MLPDAIWRQLVARGDWVSETHPEIVCWLESLERFKRPPGAKLTDGASFADGVGCRPAELRVLANRTDMRNACVKGTIMNFFLVVWRHGGLEWNAQLRLGGEARLSCWFVDVIGWTALIFRTVWWSLAALYEHSSGR